MVGAEVACCARAPLHFKTVVPRMHWSAWHGASVTVLSVSSQTSLLKAGALQGYEDAVRMYERGRAYSRELDACGRFGHLPHKA